MSKRKQHAPELKAKLVLEALKGKVIVSELASRFGVHPKHDQPIELGGSENDSVNRFLDQRTIGWSDRCFERGSRKAQVIDEDQVRDLHAKIGELAVANYFFERKLKPWGGN